MKTYRVIPNLFLILGMLVITQIDRSESKSLLSTNPLLGIAPQGHPFFFLILSVSVSLKIFAIIIIY